MTEHPRISKTGTPPSAIDQNFMDGLRNDFRNFINVTLLDTVNNKAGFGNPPAIDGRTISAYEQITGIIVESFESSVMGTSLPTSASDFKFRMNKSITEVWGKLQSIENITPSASNQVYGIYGTFALELCAKANMAQRQISGGSGRA